MRPDVSPLVQEAQVSPANKIKTDYPSLSTISIIFKVIGIILVIISLIVFISGFSFFSNYGEETIVVYLILSSLVGGLLLSVPFFAFGELIKLFIRIELNTRKDNFQESDYKNSKSEQKNEDYEKWKMDNPDKTLNDYYASRR